MFEMKDFSLEGKVALITGASYGIGFAIATTYAKAGATIVFNDIKQELVDKGLALIKKQVSELMDTFVMLQMKMQSMRLWQK